MHEEFAAPSGAVEYRPVTIVDAGERKALELRIEVPVEDMARLGEPGESPAARRARGRRARPSGRPSIRACWSWSASIAPRLIFANSRRIAERLAAALNELAGEPLARAHHGSLARERRTEIEDQLKAGALRALVATSSLELGIDMGAIDLVIQIEAPPSVASGLQRIGRAGHQVDAVSRGIVFPKFRGDLRGVRRRHPPHARRPGGGHALSAQSARRPRPADRGHGGHGPLAPSTTSSPPCSARRPSPS